MDSKTNNLLHWQEHGAAERVKHHKAYIPSPTVMSDPQLLHWTGKEDESSRPNAYATKHRVTLPDSTVVVTVRTDVRRSEESSS